MAMLLALPWLLFSLIAYYLLSRLAHRRRRLPPGPWPLPLVGNLHNLSALPHRSLARLARTHGPIMSLRLGAVTTVVVSSPGLARDVLQRHDAVFAARFVPRALDGRYARSSVSWLPPTHRRWRALRRAMAAGIFAPRRLDELRHLRRDKVRQLVEHVARVAAEEPGAAVDVGRVASATSLNLLSCIIFSLDLACLDDVGATKGLQELVTEILDVGGNPNVSDFFPALAAADLQGARRRMARLFARLHLVFDAEVDRRLRERDAGGPRKDDFLDALLDDDEAVLDRDTLRSLFTVKRLHSARVKQFAGRHECHRCGNEDLFVAGSDSTSNTVEWAMTEVLRNPTIMGKACDELRRVVGSRTQVEETVVDELPYLQAMIKETFRLHPPGPLLLPRQVAKKLQIGGYMVPKGARVLVNIWAIGQDDKIWSEPEKFIPERFSTKGVDLRGGDFTLIPFGAGCRICPGMPLGIRMVHVVVASLLNHFGWRLPEDVKKRGIDMKEKLGVSLTKVEPLCAIPMAY